MPLALLAGLAIAACPVPPAPAGSAPSEPAPARPAAVTPAAAFDHTHAAWEGILREHVHEGGFDYASLAREPGPLHAYLEELWAVTPEELEGWTREQRYAFWIDAYNAHTVWKVVDNWPLESIRDLDKAFGLNTVFEQSWIPMERLNPTEPGEKLSLNDIEHAILRARFQDARVHAAINCASESCPPLRPEAFVAERLDAQLDEQMRAFVRDPSRNRLDREEDVLRLSEIFKWFAEDFERDAGSVREYLVRFSPDEDAAFLREARIRYLDYSWELNDAPGE